MASRRAASRARTRLARGSDGIGGEKLLIALQRIALDRGGIGVLRAKLVEELRPHGIDPLRREGWRRRVRLPHEKDEGRRDPRCVPRHKCPFGLFVYAQPHAVEDIRCRQAAFPNHFGERPRIGAIGPALGGRNGAWRGVESNEHVRFGVGERQATGQWRTGLRERRVPRRVKDDQARLEGKPGKPLCIIGNAQRFDGHILRRRDLRVHGHEIVFAIELQAITSEIDESHGVRPGGLRLVEKVPECRAQGFAIEVTRAAHVEAGRLEGLGDEARVIGRGGKLARLIGCVANHKVMRFSVSAIDGDVKASKKDEGQASEMQFERGFHDYLYAGRANFVRHITVWR